MKASNLPVISVYLRFIRILQFFFVSSQNPIIMKSEVLEEEDIYVQAQLG